MYAQCGTTHVLVTAVQEKRTTDKQTVPFRGYVTNVSDMPLTEINLDEDTIVGFLSVTLFVLS